MPDVSLVIPFLNEEDNLSELIPLLNEYAMTQAFSIEAIFVDDGSTDSSVQILREKVSEKVPIKLVRLSKNFGSHAAIRAGIIQAVGSYTMFFSADLQEPFSMIGEMYAKICEGFDIVSARKAEVQISLLDKLFSNLFTILIRKFAVKDYPIGGANNFLFNKKVKDCLCSNIENNSSIHMQIISMGFRKAVIDVSLNKRYMGVSKWTYAKKMKLFIDSFVAFSYFPIRLISLVGLVLFICGFIYALFIIVSKFTGFIQFDIGFPTLISVLLLGFGLTNLALGIIAEYLWRTLDTARGRPVFIIDTVEILSGGGENG
jgi:dolichol-phosphate mannosyltransferase